LKKHGLYFFLAGITWDIMRPHERNAMFKNRALQVKMVKTGTEEEPVDEVVSLDPEQIAKIAKELVKHTAIAIGALIVTTAVATAAKEIAIKKA